MTAIFQIFSLGMTRPRIDKRVYRFCRRILCIFRPSRRLTQSYKTTIFSIFPYTNLLSYSQCNNCSYLLLDRYEKQTRVGVFHATLHQLKIGQVLVCVRIKKSFCVVAWILENPTHFDSKQSCVKQTNVTCCHRSNKP